MSFRAAFFSAAISAGLIFVAWGQTQAGSQAPDQARVVGVAPEDAYLSPTAYTNAYFGFRFEFPDGVSLKPVPMPAATERRIQLLELVGSTSQHAVVSFSAYEYKNKNYT